MKIDIKLYANFSAICSLNEKIFLPRIKKPLQTVDILRNYRRPILMTDSNPVHSGNKSIQIKSRRHHHPEMGQPGDDLLDPV
mgnify:CR=1 FL=1